MSITIIIVVHTNGAGMVSLIIVGISIFVNMFRRAEVGGRDVQKGSCSISGGKSHAGHQHNDERW